MKGTALTPHESSGWVKGGRVLVIREMRVDDVPAVAAIDRRCASPPWSENTFTAEVKKPAGHYLVAEVAEAAEVVEAAGRLVGYAGAQAVLDEAHVTTFGVAPEHRRLGIGGRLLASLLERLVRLDCRRITLEVRAGNLEAQRLYRRFGFQPVGRRPRYYHDIDHDNDEDAVVMWIEDTGRPGFRSRLAGRPSPSSGGTLAELRSCADEIPRTPPEDAAAGKRCEFQSEFQSEF